MTNNIDFPGAYLAYWLHVSAASAIAVFSV